MRLKDKGEKKTSQTKKKILLVGNPNVGKSTLFSHLTGINTITSNYAGTTVEYKKGNFSYAKNDCEIIDVPGTYSLHANNKAEEVAAAMIKEGDVLINIIDATNLERNLYLTLQLLAYQKPMIIALNFWNETNHKGITINIKRLEQLLGVPVIPLVATTGEGIKTLVTKLAQAQKPKKSVPWIERKKKKSNEGDDDEIWKFIGKIIKEVQHISPHSHTFLQRLEDLTIQPLTGIPFAFFVLFGVFWLIRFIGEGLITLFLDPLFDFLLPYLTSLSTFLGGSGFLHDLLLGQLINGKIDYLQSMGMLTTGLYVPLAMVFPYILAFYLVLTLLEDSGYLPRLSTLVDNVTHLIGLHGMAVIPLLLGAGCNVPGVLATRVLETKKERFIVITLLSIGIPCAAQTAMIYGLLGKYGIKALAPVFLTLFFVWIILGLILKRYIKGDIPETFIEIPPYRLPPLRLFSKKLWWRIKGFFKEAIPYMFLGVFLANIIYLTNLFSVIEKIAAPLITKLFGLPKEAVLSLLMGFLRKDVAVGMLLPLGLTMKQLIIVSVILTMYFPCVATFVTVFKEMGLKDTVKMIGIMLGATLLVGTLLNLLL